MNVVINKKNFAESLMDGGPLLADLPKSIKEDLIRILEYFSKKEVESIKYENDIDEAMFWIQADKNKIRRIMFIDDFKDCSIKNEFKEFLKKFEEYQLTISHDKYEKSPSIIKKIHSFLRHPFG